MGLLAGIAICTKQTVGVFVAIGVVTVKLLFVSNNKEFKQYVKIALIRCIGVLFPCIIFVGFLIISGSLKDFIDYALLGIKTFSNSIPYSALIREGELIIKILSIILPMVLLSTIIFIINEMIRKRTSPLLQTLKVMTIYSIVMIIVIYPISDTIHFLIATLPLLIELIYVIFILLKRVYDKDKTKNKKVIVFIMELTIILTMILLGSIRTYKNLNEYVQAREKEEEFLNSNDSMKELEHYNNIVVPDYIRIREEKIQNIMKDNEKKVIILDADAVVFNIIQNVYYKNYSMFLKGNIGKDGEDGIIEDIKHTTNCIYIVKKEGARLNWQTPKKVIEYVRNNLVKRGEIGICEIYESNR